MEFKREQLIVQIKKIWENYIKVRKRFITRYIKVMILLNRTYKEMGKKNVVLIGKLSKIHFTPSINIQIVKAVGISIPKIKYELKQEEKLPAYTFNDTSHFLDDVINLLQDFFAYLIKFGEIEDLMIKISLNFKKINRRINGLKNMIIPRLKSNISQIKDILEELDRERYVRLKKTKDLILTKNEII